MTKVIQEFNGVQIHRSWKLAGEKPKPLSWILEEDMKLVLCSQGYMALCIALGCQNVTFQSGKLCKAHSLGKDVYRYCREGMCTKSAGYGYETKKGLYCKTHKQPDMVDVKHLQCEAVGCTTRSTFGYEGEKVRFCVKHKIDDMVNIIDKKCEHPTCRVRPNFGYEGESCRFCGKHKLVDMIDLGHPKCEAKGCYIRPNFGYEGEKARFCFKHKANEMINIVDKRCKYPKCKIRPIFGYVGQYAEYCFAHKLQDMVDVTHNKCETNGCHSRPNFGYEGEKARFCSKHKLEHMIDIKHIKCEEPNCTVRPVFGFEGSNPRFCTKHKHDGMIDLVTKRCEYPKCTITAFFGYKDGKRKFCSKHKLKDMISLGGRCKHTECPILPSYRPLHSKSINHCRAHCSLNEYHISKSKPRCTFIGCHSFAYFMDASDPNVYPVRCQEHRFSTDIELIFRPCKKCEESLYYPANRDVCMDCGNYRAVTLYYFKELHVKYVFQSNNIEFIHNRALKDAKSKYRPDFLIEASFGYIIVEVDEFQHKKEGYDQQKEINRMISLYQDIPPKQSLIFIRFNPDRYSGVQYDLSQRHEYLCQVIRNLLELPIFEIPLSVLYLFYDGFDRNPTIQPISTSIIAESYMEEPEIYEEEDEEDDEE